MKHHIVLQQGHSPPKQKACFRGSQSQPPSGAPQSHWQHIPADPIEEFFNKFGETAKSKHQIVPDALPCLPANKDLVTQSATVPDGLVEWDMGKLVDLSLWGAEEEDNESSYEEEMAIQRARRRDKGYRPASPARFSNNHSIPSMVDILEGMMDVLSFAYKSTYSFSILDYTTSPKRKRKLPSSMEFLHFLALQTTYVEKQQGDPWTRVTSYQPVRLAISRWSPGNVKTGWIGEGFSKFAVLVCVILELWFERSY
jgi:hypothetical protein